MLPVRIGHARFEAKSALERLPPSRARTTRAISTGRNPDLRGIPKLFFGQVFFGGLGNHGQHTTHFPENRYFWAVGGSCAHPLDLLKMRMQLQTKSSKLNMMQMGRRIVTSEGALGLFKGVDASACRQLANSGPLRHV